ncbi:hypothetical protein F5X99DRAFT_411044 [Biscogniauxia marginata]|nr:hypothetical protein F5X99DRAFT_411044 [Biscogniauxia marginata]
MPSRQKQALSPEEQKIEDRRLRADRKFRRTRWQTNSTDEDKNQALHQALNTIPGGRKYSWMGNQTPLSPAQTIGVERAMQMGIKTGKIAKELKIGVYSEVPKEFTLTTGDVAMFRRNGIATSMEKIQKLFRDNGMTLPGTIPSSSSSSPPALEPSASVSSSPELSPEPSTPAPAPPAPKSPGPTIIDLTEAPKSPPRRASTPIIIDLTGASNPSPPTTHRPASPVPVQSTSSAPAAPSIPPAAGALKRKRNDGPSDPAGGEEIDHTEWASHGSKKKRKTPLEEVGELLNLSDSDDDDSEEEEGDTSDKEDDNDIEESNKGGDGNESHDSEDDIDSDDYDLDERFGDSGNW